jgi:hypothetical protein
MAAGKWVGGLVLVCLACGGEAPPVVTAPTLHITAKPPAPPPERARWVFAHPDRSWLAKVDLADGATLYVGRNGRRELQKGTERKDAPTLAMGDLVGVLGNAKEGFTFVAADGSTFTAKDPLGPLDPLHAGPVDKASARLVVATGKAAILAVTPDRKLLRSVDRGATWKEVAYAGASTPYGRPGDVALDSKGNGVLVHFPQRLFVTHDDGATWAPLGSLRLGVRAVGRDGHDRIFVEGIGARYAELDGSALVASPSGPSPIFAAPTMSPTAARDAIEAERERTRVRTLLTGDRFVELDEISHDGKPSEVRIASAKLGEKLPKPISSTDLVGGSGMSKHIAAWGPEIVYLRDDDDPDANAATTTVLRSKDYGQTWHKETQLTGLMPERDDGADVAVGPKSWTYVASLCPKDESSGPGCGRRQVRPAGAAKFEDLAFVEEFEPRSFAFDEVHDRVFAIGVHESRAYVYVSPLAENKFSRTKLLDAPAWMTVALTVDAHGEPRVLRYDAPKGAWALHALGEGGKEADPRYVALPRGTLAFAGPRGVLFATRSQGWETADGGDTWVRIATNGYARSLVCSEAGCMNGDAQRVGWDLPAVHATSTVTAQATPPASTIIDGPHHASVVPVDVVCKVSGPATPLSAPPGTDMVDGTAADRWASISSDADGKTSVVVGTKNAVHELPLLGATPKPAAHAPARDVRFGQRVLDDGVVVARYQFTPKRLTGTYNPVDVELGWWSARTGRVRRHTIPKVKPFRVSRYGFSGMPDIVDGGFLFQGAANDPAYFVRDDGKVERIALPAIEGQRSAEHVGKRWLLGDGYAGTVRLSASDDGGKSWTRTAWTLDLWGSFGLVRSGAGASVTYGSSLFGPASLLFPVGATLADDPPAPVVLQESAVEPVCDAHAGRHRFSTYLSSDERPIRVRIDNVQGKDKWTTFYTPSRRVSHDMPGGKMCASAYLLDGSDTHGGRYDYQTIFVYPEAKGGYAAWRFRRAPAHAKKAYVAEPMTCK